MYDFYYHNPAKVYFGANKLEELATMKLPGTKAMIVTTPEKFYVDRVQALLKKNGIDSVLFDKARPNPTHIAVNEAAALAKQEGCDFLVSIGGGSSTDSAKAIGIAMNNPGDIWDYVGIDCREDAKPVTNGSAPVVAISTTSGTGTEVSPFAVIMNDEANAKLDLFGDHVFPTIAIVDPCLQTSLPPALTACQGMDVIFHASEGFINIAHNPITDMYARDSLKLAQASLAEAYKNGSNVEARGNMALASLFAGFEETISGGISLHAISHTFASFHNTIPHGIALCTADIECFAYYAKYNQERMAEMSALLGYGDEPEGFVQFLTDIQKEVDLYNIDITKYGLDPKRAREYAEHCTIVTAGYHVMDKHPMSTDECEEIIFKGLTRCLSK